MSARNLRRKQKRYKDEGINGLKHGLIGRKGNNNGIDEEIKERVIELFEQKYSDYGPTLMSEKLAEKHGITIDHETLRRLLIKEQLWQVRKKKERKHFWRERKHCEGEMVQADGSRHIWLSNDTYIDLLALIDDATGKIYVQFGSESTKDFAQFFKEFVEKKGRPWQFYCDKGKVFKVNNSKRKPDAQTQFERMLGELEVKIIYARSPQAKGRVERLFRTLQDRLQKALREENIRTLDAANKYLRDSNFIKIFNEKFSVEAKSEAVVYKSIENFNLNSIFCKKYYRNINNDRTLQFKQSWYQLLRKQPVRIQPSTKVEVRVAFDETVSLFKNNQKLNYKPIEKRRKKAKKPKVCNQRSYQKPAPNHPWRTWVEKEENPDNLKESKRGHF